uniref:Uncharacterized protein n=1 Tax=Knipowitschia caucasica TaxID=637954 RepID=A0AAV2JFG6_KNICA
MFHRGARGRQAFETAPLVKCYNLAKRGRRAMIESPCGLPPSVFLPQSSSLSLPPSVFLPQSSSLSLTLVSLPQSPSQAGATPPACEALEA